MVQTERGPPLGAHRDPGAVGQFEFPGDLQLERRSRHRVERPRRPEPPARLRRSPAPRAAPSGRRKPPAPLRGGFPGRRAGFRRPSRRRPPPVRGAGPFVEKLRPARSPASQASIPKAPSTPDIGPSGAERGGSREVSEKVSEPPAAARAETGVQQPRVDRRRPASELGMQLMSKKSTSPRAASSGISEGESPENGSPSAR